VLQQGTTESIDIGIRIFNFANCAQKGWNCLEAEIGQITDIIIFDVSLSK
jgi:hypothetical protein